MARGRKRVIDDGADGASGFGKALVDIACRTIGKVKRSNRRCRRGLELCVLGSVVIVLA
ncbi:hypothetical protein F442_07791 [Phytophthora nicotianae P10297]|uniref:Uncharacterized protein n=1 Tax=Phytophthora nicotianae P10297 TaxID=1317064 RepID=W2ZEX1_PHYNI|nr:hypothetical protein F442_07791 [Phytophthora nicotianae P10297]